VTLAAALRSLRRFFGKPTAPVSQDPFHLILWEQVGYLVTDDVRREAFVALRAATGLTPEGVAAATVPKLTAIARRGGAIAARERATRMRDSANEVLRRWDGDLSRALKLPEKEARRALASFPMIGQPGADRIMVIAGTARLLPLDSNGLRVVQRLGLSEAGSDYRASYAAAQQALRPQLPRSRPALLDGYAHLRRLGQEICRRATPDCEVCPLRADCPTGSARLH